MSSCKRRKKNPYIEYKSYGIIVIKELLLHVSKGSTAAKKKKKFVTINSIGFMI